MRSTSSPFCHSLIRALILLFAVLVVAISRPIAIKAQAPTPEPTLAALQATVQAQENKIERVKLDVDEKYLPLTVVASVLGILGIVSPFVAYRYFRNQAKKMIDKAIYKIDPVNAIVHIPASGFEREAKHLKLRGFYKLRTYRTLDNTCLEGCVVVRIETEDDITDFRSFLQKYCPKEDKVAYVLYTQMQIPSNIVNDFPNITFANSLMTLGTNLFSIARGLIR